MSTTWPPSDWPKLWEAAIELWHHAIPAYTPRFIYRDFYSGNVLWARGHATGIVDWANASAGPPGCDVATCRANLLDLAGDWAADDFQAAHEALTGQVLHPHWEMATILEAAAASGEYETAELRDVTSEPSRASPSSCAVPTSIRQCWGGRAGSGVCAPTARAR
jgi:aminoglycoside phosphotransferase (APT) family kinase protein